MVHGRGKIYHVIMEILGKIAVVLEAMEKIKRRGVHNKDVSGDEEATPNCNIKPKVE